MKTTNLVMLLLVMFSISCKNSAQDNKYDNLETVVPGNIKGADSFKILYEGDAEIFIGKLTI